jgi:hypothetical protein
MNHKAIFEILCLKKVIILLMVHFGSYSSSLQGNHNTISEFYVRTKVIILLVKLVIHETFQLQFTIR